MGWGWGWERVINFCHLAGGGAGLEKNYGETGGGGGRKNFVDLNENVPPPLIINDLSLKLRGCFIFMDKRFTQPF